MPTRPAPCDEMSQGMTKRRKTLAEFNSAARQPLKQFHRAQLRLLAQLA